MMLEANVTGNGTYPVYPAESPLASVRYCVFALVNVPSRGAYASNAAVARYRLPSVVCDWLTRKFPACENTAAPVLRLVIP